MKNFPRLSILLLLAMLLVAGPAAAQSLTPDVPTWWAKYQSILKHSAANTLSADPLTVGINEDASNECGPQSETFITLNHSTPANLTAGSNEIFRLPMRGYFSSDGGSTWGAVDVPLPLAIGGVNSFDFGSDPSLAYDTRGNVFYSFIVVYFSNFHGLGGKIDGTELAVARSTNGGQSYPQLSLFSFSTGENHFNDKPMIAADTNLSSPFRDNVYVAWDASSGGSSSGGVRLARSTDHGATFTV